MIKIAIADANLEYSERLISVLEDYKDLNISLFTDKNALELALSSKKYDILLFDQSVYDGQVSPDKNTLVVMLFDTDEEVLEQTAKYQKINKYQRISKIYQQLLNLYAEVCKDKGVIIGQERSKSIAFYSPVGGVGTTTLALAAATRCADMGYRTLYINYEDIASDEFYLPRTDDKGMSDIAATLGENINFSMKLQSLLLTKQENLFYMNHFDSPNDIYELSGEELAEIISKIQSVGLFDFVIVDMSTSVDKKVISIFEALDHIVLVERNDSVSMSKLQSFVALDHIINPNISKFSRVVNFDRGRGSRLDTKIPAVGSVSIVNDPDCAQLVAMLAKDSSMSFITHLE